MTAVANGATADVELLLRRAARRANEEVSDEAITALADTVRPLIGTGTGSVDVSEWMREVDRVTAELTAARSKIDQLNTQLVEQRRQLAAEHDETRETLRERTAQRDELTAKVGQLEAEAVEVANDLSAAHQALDELAAQNVEPHRHLYPAPAPGETPADCDCGHPYPRAAIARPRADVPAPRPEPWAGMFDRLRTELADWKPGRRR